MSKIAVIKTGGKQYKVKEGDIFDIEKIDGSPRGEAGKDGKKITFKDILLIADKDGKIIEIGTPVLKGKQVEASLIKQFKDDKVTVIKYKAKTRYRRKKGHRQNLTSVKIEKIA